MALEHKLKVDDLLYGVDFASAMSGGPPGLVNVGVVDAMLKVKRLNRVVHKRWILKDKVITTVIHDEVAFRWLPWVGGKINYANLEGKDLLSGMFTGCWMAVYKQGNLRVAHIATQTDDTDCKAAWRLHKALPTVSEVQEFLPHRDLAGTFNLALVTSASALYKLQLASEKTIMIPNPWPTTEEWMAPDKGKKPKEVAEYMATKAEVNAYDIYGVSGYRIVKLMGPLAAEAFPTV